MCHVCDAPTTAKSNAHWADLKSQVQWQHAAAVADLLRRIFSLIPSMAALDMCSDAVIKSQLEVLRPNRTGELFKMAYPFFAVHCSVQQRLTVVCIQTCPVAPSQFG